MTVEPAATPDTQPTPAPSPGPAAGVIGTGSRIGMTINERACTLSALVGDKFTATVTNTTVGTNGATIRAGTTVVQGCAHLRQQPVMRRRGHDMDMRRG